MRGKADHNWNSQTGAPSKAARLRAMLTSPELEFLMEAHNGLSAKIVEEAGQWLDVDDAADFTRAGKFL